MEGRQLKAIVCGAMGVGKTSILRRLSEGVFQENHAPTIGVNVIVRTLKTSAGAPVTLQIWDTAGQERFRAMVKSYFRDANLILFVFDVGNRWSLEMLFEWVETSGWMPRDARPERCQAYLVGNKSDLMERTVSVEEAESFGMEHDMLYTETSAKTGANIEELFGRAAENAHAYHVALEQKATSLERERAQPLLEGASGPLVVVSAPPHSKKGSCCK